MTIKKYFNIFFLDNTFKVVYAELSDGTFTKTYTKNNEVEIDIITPSEYASAMAYNNYMKMKNTNHN
jgi:hypothetical protein